MHRNTPSVALLSLALALAACGTHAPVAPRQPAAGVPEVLAPPPRHREVAAAADAAERAAGTAGVEAATIAPGVTPAVDVAGTSAYAALAAKPSVEHEAPPPPAPAPSTAWQRIASPTLAVAQPAPREEANRERYAPRDDNAVQLSAAQPVSTFSIDVDTGSYSNVRRMLLGGVRPPADAVRAEEFLNYFDHGHPGPASLATPFWTTTELAPAPWNPDRQLLMIGIKGYDVPKAKLPPANLVFLIDTSGSMDQADKLPLLKDAFAQLVPNLRRQDRVSIVVYAGSAGLVLPPTPGDRHDLILGALERLQAGGGTNGGAGIALAYGTARQAFVRDGINRVILATDGDFNLGTVDDGALKTLVADQRKAGIALTTFGFGQGNYNDALAESLADVGDGNHAYIDTALEARKVLVDEMQSTLLTIAQDVKIQVEFNPEAVASYRLIGYENRALKREDFANDRVDAGDIGAGHQVTALYELTLAGSTAAREGALRYAPATPVPAVAGATELAHLRLRYKRPGETRSRLLETPILRSERRMAASPRLRFAATVAAFADALRGGTHLGTWTWTDIAANARQTRGEDRWGLRQELVGLIDAGRALAQPLAPQPAIAVAE